MAMTDQEKKDFDAALASAARWEALASEITVEEREYAKRLEPTVRKAFFQKDAGGRKAELELDVEVYKSADGRSFRKSHHPDIVEAVRATDASKAQVAATNAELRKSRFAKRAVEELPYLTGTAEERATIFEYAETLPKEAGEKFLATMKSASNANREKFVETGSREGGDGAADTAESRYAVALKKYAGEKKESEVDATEGFLNTAEGLALYRAIQSEKRSVAKMAAAAR